MKSKLEIKINLFEEKMQKFCTIKNFYIASIGLGVIYLLIVLVINTNFNYEIYEYNIIANFGRTQFVNKDIPTMPNPPLTKTATTSRKITQIPKLPASNILLQVDSTNFDLNYVSARQYENAISDQLATKEAIFKTDVNERFRNKLNLYVWRDLNSAFVEVLRGVVGFPFNPMMRDYATSLSISRENKYSDGKRVFGYLTTPVSGNYKLAVSSSKHSEIWLSTNHHPTLASKVAWIGSWEDNRESSTPNNNITQLASQQSAVLHFNADQLYYIEIMHACDTIDSHVKLFWASVDSTVNNGTTTPVEPSDFEIIGAEYLVLHHLYMDDQLIAESRAHASVLPMHKQTIINIQSSPDHRIEMLKLPILKGGFLKEAIEVCDPIPQNVQAHNVGRYNGYKEVRMHSLYPEDGTNHYDDRSSHSPWIDKDQVDRFMMMLKNQLKNKTFSLEIEEILNLETIPYLVTPGVRLLVEAKVKLGKNDATVYRLSEYLFLPAKSLTFCYLPDFQWERDAFIYMGIPVKNQGHWVRHTVENLERLQNEISDENWGLIISDYESTDMDVLALLIRSTLRHWKYVRLEGSFSRSHGINAFLNEMSDGDMIGLSCDLQLDIPLNFFDVIRTHTIRGLAVVAPTVMRLSAGRFYFNPFGFWEYLGYGLVGMYLRDWNGIGGMNTNEFGNKWGGEDWEFMDRCVSKGVEVQRMIIRNLYHYFHTKEGTWDSKDTVNVKYFK